MSFRQASTASRDVVADDGRVSRCVDDAGEALCSLRIRDQSDDVSPLGTSECNRRAAMMGA